MARTATATTRAKSGKRTRAESPRVAPPSVDLRLVRASSVDVAGLKLNALHDEHARLVLADLFEESNHAAVADLLRGPTAASVVPALDRPDVMRLWFDDLPDVVDRRKRVDKLTSDEEAQFDPWVKRW